MQGFWCRSRVALVVGPGGAVASAGGAAVTVLEVGSALRDGSIAAGHGSKHPPSALPGGRLS
jgi:hypothetical protein